MSPTILSAPAAVSPLVLSDRLLTLAQDADRVGQRDTALHLLALAHNVLDQAPGRI